MKKNTVIIQGIEGSFHHIAATKYFDDEINILPAETFTSLIKKTEESNGAFYGIMAIENSIAGSILRNYGLLQNSYLRIEGEIYINIKQNLLTLPDTELKDIREIHSHNMAIQQCERFINKHLPNVKIVETSDTALSAKNISENKLQGIATIASDMAAELFSLKIIKSRIETIKNNQTRFFILTSNNIVRTDFNKASIYFKTSHQVGSLYKVLEQFSLHDINLSKLQSFPILEEPWQYFFHTDLEFSTTQQFCTVLEKIKPLTNNLIILGKYKKGKRIL